MNEEANPNFTSSCGTANIKAATLNDNTKSVSGTANINATSLNDNTKSLSGTANINATSLNDNTKSLSETANTNATSLNDNTKSVSGTENKNTTSVSKPTETLYLRTKGEVPNLIPVPERVINITYSESAATDKYKISGKVEANSSATFESTSSCGTANINVTSLNDSTKSLSGIENTKATSISKPNEALHLKTSKREIPNLIPIPARVINITYSESGASDTCKISEKVEANSSATFESTQLSVDQTSKLTSNTNATQGKDAIVFTEIDIFLLNEANKEIDKIKEANFKIITEQIGAIINVTLRREVSFTNESNKILAAEVKKEIDNLIMINLKANAKQIAIKANLTFEKGVPSTEEKAKKLIEANEKIKRIMAANVNDIANKIAKQVMTSISSTS